MRIFRKTIVMSVDLLPKEYLNYSTIKEAVKAYEKDFKVKIIPIDTSRQNLQGSSPMFMKL